MGRLVWMAMIGGGLVVLAWLVLGAAIARHKATARRRALEALAADRERRARQAPGGNPGDPLEVVSAAVVEPKASSLPCVRCQGAVRLVEHQACTLEGQRLRVAVVECGQCGLRREIFFRLRLADDA